ncbi:DNA-binding SARP family transcriptional activator [Streptosporangium becharense]|uniref:DNA-binding SARP family transcriptional activator n=1 Tax=Streptosporangium becharense TaxID=1816182 RepID=A0A7W9ILP3_9ACTN|nr:BTAD domain-containing putative transcriptional regulator [Streptosporangium becharense]MBB2911739.1 DNA-binding SARP family transcriptional activator [Streptosporangium becharense]MBB5822443.1 DNA-binding SARP family transcriptional activator [Streptosporangium becharense]
MRFQVLGSVGVYDDDGTPVDLRGPRQRAVLARLLIAQGAVVSTDTLIEDLYDGSPPASALSTLQSYMSNLRRVIEPERVRHAPPQVLIGRQPGYLLAAADVDALEFAELVNRSEFRSPDEALASLDRALRLWRGVPYGEFADRTWAVTEVHRLGELRLVAVERRAQALLDLGRPQPVINELEVETLDHPLRERLWCLLALALYRTGRQADALAVLRRAREVLAEQLGLDPGPELRALEEDILRQVESLDPVRATAVLLAAAPSAQRRVVLGRERQFAALQSLLDRGGTAVAAVTGEAGIGKTFLLEAFRDHCADLGYLVLWGSCHDIHGAPPLWPWFQVLGALAQHHPPPDRPALAGLLDDEKPSGSTEAARLRRNQAVAEWLITAARTQPLVVVLDDLHWADPASLELLKDVIMLTGRPAGNATLKIVTAFRDTAFQGTAFRGTAAHAPVPDGGCGLSADDMLARLVPYDLHPIRLRGLDADAVRSIAANMGAEVDEPTALRLADRTGGNPYFVRESVRLLAEGRPLSEVPDAVVKVIRQRIGALAPQVGEVLGIAAVIGRDFDPGIVAEVCQSEVYGPLDQAAQAGLIVPHAGRMVFTHDLVCETLIRDIPPLRKAIIHRDVMAALSRRPGIDVAVIAHHAVEAGHAAYGEAVRWARAAAEQASLRLAYDEAAMWWSRAIAAHGASAGDATDHLELLLRHVQALLESGDAIGARWARGEAIRAADRAGAGPESTARALTALDAPSIWTLRNPYEPVDLRLVHRFESALRELPDTDGPERARLLGGLAQELYDGTDDPHRAALSSEAIDMARRLGDPRLLLQMLNARYLSLPAFAAHATEPLEIAAEMLETAVRAEEPGFELLAQMIFSHHRMEMFDLAGADRAAARCDAMLERLPLPWPRFQHTVWQANRLVLAGRFDDAEARYDEAERQAERIGMWHAGAVVTAGRIFLRYHRGTLAGAGTLVNVIAGIHPSADRDLRVLLLCEQGRAGEARELVSDGWPPRVRDWSWLTMTCLQGAAQAAVGDVTACRVTYAELLPYSGYISVSSAVATLGPVDWFLARLASATGHHDAAARHLATLARLADRNGLPWWRDRAEVAARALPTRPCDRRQEWYANVR